VREKTKHAAGVWLLATSLTATFPTPLDAQSCGYTFAVVFRGSPARKLTRYNLANVYYVVVEPGVLADHEAPKGWGLLVREGDELVLQTKPQWKSLEADRQLALLTQIAKSATRLWNKAFGVTGESDRTAETYE
jgi:hypothetical protein